MQPVGLKQNRQQVPGGLPGQFGQQGVVGRFMGSFKRFW
jgi:hypothetical protein